MEAVIAIIIGIVMTALTVLGDYFIKKASLQTAFEGWRLLVLAAVIWGATVFGWFYVFRKVKVSDVAILYSMSGIIMFTLLGVFVFKEKLSGFEIIGFALAIGALIILARFG